MVQRIDNKIAIPFLKKTLTDYNDQSDNLYYLYYHIAGHRVSIKRILLSNGNYLLYTDNDYTKHINFGYLNCESCTNTVYRFRKMFTYGRIRIDPPAPGAASISPIYNYYEDVSPHLSALTEDIPEIGHYHYNDPNSPLDFKMTGRSAFSKDSSLKLARCYGCANYFVESDPIYKSQTLELCMACHLLQRTCIICLKPNPIETVALKGIRVHELCVYDDVSSKICEFCKVNRITKSEIVCKTCEKHIIFDYNFKPAPIFYPSLELEPSEPRLGLELETEIKSQIRDVVFKKDLGYKFIKEVNSFAYLKRDSSIGINMPHDRGDAAFEIVTHPATINWWNSEESNVFFEAVSKLAKFCSSYNTGNCGIHVHISRNKFKSRMHQAAFGWFFENRVYFTSVIAERNSLEYAKIGLNNWNTIAKSAYTSKDHHSLVSYTEHTIEIRPFRGNLRKERILKDIQYVYAVFDWTKSIISSAVKVEDFWTILTTNAFEEFINSNPSKYKILIEFINAKLNPIFAMEAVGLESNKQQEQFDIDKLLFIAYARSRWDFKNITVMDMTEGGYNTYYASFTEALAKENYQDFITKYVFPYEDLKTLYMTSVITGIEAEPNPAWNVGFRVNNRRNLPPLTAIRLDEPHPTTATNELTAIDDLLAYNATNVNMTNAPIAADAPRRTWQNWETGLDVEGEFDNEEPDIDDNFETQMNDMLAIEQNEIAEALNGV